MNGLVNAILGTVVAVSVIAGVVVLTWHGSIDGQAAVGIFGALVGGGGAVVAHSAGAKSAGK